MLFIGGYKVFAADAGDAARIINLCRSIGVRYRDTVFDGDRVFFKCSLLASGRLEKRCAEAGIAILCERVCGIPSLFFRYRRRYGVFAGILLFAAILFFSGRVIWDIRIDGNSRLSDDQVIEQLGECGLSVGDLRRGIETSTVENRVMIASEDISWMSINIIGTVAEVEIRESEVAEEREEERYAASNIVAARDGYIELFEDVRGKVVLSIGDYVREGELIVSGLYDSKTGEIRYTNARGKVLGRVERDIRAEIPLVYDKKVYTGRVFTEKYLIFFEKEVKFCGNSGNSYESCDTINTVEYLDIFSAGELPVGIRTVKHMEYTYERAERTPEEAERLAEYKLGCELGELMRERELIRKSVSGRLTDTAFVFECRIECIENIARIKKIEIEGLP